MEYSFRTNSEVKEASRPTAILWEIKDWKNERTKILENAKCFFEIKNDDDDDDRKCYKLMTTLTTHESYGPNSTKTFMKLLVTLISGQPPVGLQFNVDIMDKEKRSVAYALLNDEAPLLILQSTDIGNATIVFNSHSNQWMKHFNGTSCDNDLPLRITVKAQFYKNTAIGNASLSNKKPDPVKSILHDLKELRATDAGDDYSDLKVETKDNMTLSTHKVLLAARSSVLKELIDKEMKNNSFNGTVKIPEVNGKPLTAILHWIYTGELQDGVEKCLEEVVDGAVLFQLNDMIKLLDKEMIKICNNENMFRLYQTARNTGMPTAMEEIADFIKGNI